MTRNRASRDHRAERASRKESREQKAADKRADRQRSVSRLTGKPWPPRGGTERGGRK